MDSRPPWRFWLNGSGEGPSNWHFLQCLVSFCKHLPRVLSALPSCLLSPGDQFSTQVISSPGWQSWYILWVLVALRNYSGWATLCSRFSVADFHTRPLPNIPFQSCATCGAPAAEFLTKFNPGEIMAHPANSSQWRCHIEKFLACVSLPKA